MCAGIGGFGCKGRGGATARGTFILRCGVSPIFAPCVRCSCLSGRKICGKGSGGRRGDCHINILVGFWGIVAVGIGGFVCLPFYLFVKASMTKTLPRVPRPFGCNMKKVRGNGVCVKLKDLKGG